MFAKFDQLLPVRSHFDTKRPVIFFHIATIPSLPLDRFLRSIVLCFFYEKQSFRMPRCFENGNGDFGPEAFRAIHCAQLSTNGQAVS